MKSTIVPLLAALCAPFAVAAQEPAPSPLDIKISEQISEGSGLTAEEVVKRARATSFELRAGQEGIVSASAAIDEALTGYIPKLTLTGSYTRLSSITAPDIGNVVAAPSVGPGPIPAGTPLINVPLSFPVLLNLWNFQGQISVPISDYILRTPHLVRSARATERAAVDTQAATFQNVGLSAIENYYAWVRARLAQIVAEQALEQQKANLSDVQKQAQVGTASRADVLRVEAQVAQAELDLVRARNQSELTQEQLRTIMHDPLDRSYTLGEDVRGEVPPVVGDETLAPLLAEAHKRRPELKAFSENVEAARAQGRALTAGYIPRVDVFADLYYQNPNTRFTPAEEEFKATWDAGVQLTWVISDIPGTAARKAQNRAQVRQLEAQRSQTADGIRLEIVAALQGVKEARAAIETTITGLATAEESYRVRRVLFQNGRATSLELTDSQLQLTQARLNHINARVDLRVARARLLKAIGM